MPWGRHLSFRGDLTSVKVDHLTAAKSCKSEAVSYDDFPANLAAPKDEETRQAEAKGENHLESSHDKCT